jgi:predicted nucleotidyltransferase
MKSWEHAPLKRRERQAIEVATEELKKRYSMEKVILFGSKARGDSDESSDIDLLLITTNPLHWREEKAIVDMLFDLGMEYDVVFTPLFAALEEWNRGIFREFPVYKDIVEEGAVVL